MKTDIRVQRTIDTHKQTGHKSNNMKRITIF